jgi:hypothetical protein
MKIYTFYYGSVKKIEKADIVPIGISLQTPKWFLGETIKSLAPSYSMLKMNKSRYEIEFGKILEKTTAKAVINELRSIGKGKDVALLCYESLHKEGEWCHRTMLAGWLQEHGYEVLEFKV